jgi:hypothetical protein
VVRSNAYKMQEGSFTRNTDEVSKEGTHFFFKKQHATINHIGHECVTSFGLTFILLSLDFILTFTFIFLKHRTIFNFLVNADQFAETPL